MHFRVVGVAAFALVLGVFAGAQDSSTPPQDQTPPGAAPATGPGAGSGAGFGRGQGRGRGGWGGGMMAGRGVAGTVSEVAADHYTIKTVSGETYTVQYSPNTHILKQPAQRAAGGMRVPPQELKATDIHVGDVIMAAGQIDTNAKSVGAMSVVKVDPERAREMREMQANFGKTWLMGKVTAVNETKVTLQSPVDNAEHTFAADENTSFRRRREAVTLADIQVGANVRVEGAVKEGVFVATTVNLMMPPPNGNPEPNGTPEPHEGTPPQ